MTGNHVKNFVARRGIMSRRGRWSLGLVCTLALAAITLSPSRAVASDTSVSAGLESTTGLLGEPLVFRIEVENAPASMAPPTLPKIPSFEVRFANNETTSSYQSVRIVNGVRTEESHSSVVYRYELTPSRAGDLEVPPFDFKVDGARYHFEGTAIHVAKDAPGNSYATLRVTTDRPFYYPGQSVKLRVEIQLDRTLASTPTLDLVGFDGVTGVLAPTVVLPPGSDRVTVNVNGKEAVPFAREVRTDDNGSPSLVLSFTRELTPLAEGQIDLGAARLRAVLATRTERDLFGDSVAAETKKVMLTAPAVTLDVRPLPTEGRPTCFSGAIGRFSLHVEASPLTAKVGDPVTLTMRVSGEGSLATASAPQLGTDEAWKAYESRSEADTEPHYGQGPQWKTFYQTLVPRSAGDLALPKAKFGYFDPDAAKFVTLEGPSFTARIAAGSSEATGLTRQPMDKPADGVRVVGRDVCPPITDASRLTKVRVPATAWAGLAAALFAPPFAFGLALMTTKRRERNRRDPRRRAFATASREAAKALRAAGDQLDAPDPRAFHEAVAVALANYVGAKLGVPAGAVDAAVARRDLASAGVDEAPSGEIADLLEVCDLGRFAAASVAPSERRKTLERARAAVRGVERRARLPLATRRFAAVGAALLALLIPTSSARASDPPAKASDDATALFTKATAAYQQGEAATERPEKESHFREAARLYERLAQIGYACGPVELDLGNCEARLGRRGPAILAYLRARGELPRDADVRANLAFVREGLAPQASEPEPPVVTQYMLAPHFMLTEFEESVLALGLWGLAFATLGIGTLAHRKWLGRAGGLLLVSSLVVGASVSSRVLADRWRPLAVTLEPVTLRSAPDGGSSLATVPEGATVRIEECGDKFVRVRTPSGERGYAPATSIERVSGRADES